MQVFFFLSQLKHKFWGLYPLQAPCWVLQISTHNMYFCGEILQSAFTLKTEKPTFNPTCSTILTHSSSHCRLNRLSQTILEESNFNFRYSEPSLQRQHVPKDVAIKTNLLLYRILNEQIDE